MYNCYRNPYMNTVSYLRVLHASPDAPGVDVYLNNMIVASNLKFKDFTPYLPLMPGLYNVKVFPANTQVNPVINANIEVKPNSDYTVAAAGMLKEIKPIIIDDTSGRIPVNKGQVKFVHLSPDAPAVDITLPDGTILFENIKFGETSEKLLLDPGTYTLQARVSGTDNVVLTVPNVKINPQKYYTVYAVGLVDGPPPLQVLIALDKASY
ncbi:MAG: DUF4397 domain-containing protein [Firmicutes bacterium]|nr:DUF4397 domain-containing protein [Bacillota bacterium]